MQKEQRAKGKGQRAKGKGAGRDACAPGSMLYALCPSLIILAIMFVLLVGCRAPVRNTSVNDAASDIEPVTLAIFYFDTDQEGLRNLTLDTLIIEFSQMQEFTVVERERLDKVLDEQGLSATDLVDEAVRTRVGKILGAHLTCFGSITEVDKEIFVYGYLTRVETTVNFGGAKAHGRNQIETVEAFAEQMKAGIREEKPYRIIRDISATLCFYKGEASEKEGKIQDACKWYQKALRMNPDYQEARVAIERCSK